MTVFGNEWSHPFVFLPPVDARAVLSRRMWVSEGDPGDDIRIYITSSTVTYIDINT